MARVAEIHHAQLVPTKLEALRAWLPTRDWFAGDGSQAEIAGRFRFVDPDGEVGIEVILVSEGGRLYQAPLTYRGAPLDGADDALVTTMSHSVLGQRWVYDAVADPVFASELLRTIVEADTEAGLSTGDTTLPARGSGAEGVALVPGVRVGDDLISYGDVTIHVPRHPDEAEPIGALGTLTAELVVDDEPVTLVLAELRSSATK